MTTSLVVSKTTRHLAREIQSVSYALLGELQADGDMAAALLHAKGRLEALADEAENAAAEVMLLERGSGEG